ncbi:metallophosphoesterase family protein [Thermodesulforhabdus norvegica]|uniref:Phosphoesterase n=1 Tax=Thermodesulforhabdus norvegica TaxID=39841 RepID=A0A1I4S589_9BACT|nr:YfcE family phosphodiesterase [Thermodesulforhabdus norvegica]SFM59454.1 hypothetical protein SAMN05660836_00755 [Thermodesulforhabdus norvegica]
MKIVVLSDTHLTGVTEELELICSRYCEGADMVIHLGDWTSPVVLDYFMQYHLEGVAGNSDHPAIISSLPLKKIITVGSFRVGLIHGWGSYSNLRGSIREAFRDVINSLDAVFYGHSHVPYYGRENGLIWLNPGSLFKGRGVVQSSLALVEVSGGARFDVRLIELM